MSKLTTYENFIRQGLYATKVMNTSLTQVKEVEGVQVIQNESIICESKEQYEKVKEISTNFISEKGLL